MPPDAGIAFVIVQHLDPTAHSSMPEILSRFTKMPVHVATDGVKVGPNSVYLIPPNKGMGIQSGALYSAGTEEEQHCQPSHRGRGRRGGPGLSV